MAEQLAKQLHTKVMQRGIHPGHCAVVFDGGAAAVQLFPAQDGGLPAFVQLVNDNLRAIPGKSQAGHMLKMSQKLEDTLLYSSTNVRSTPSNSVSIPLVLDVDNTAGYQTERHAEVIHKKKQYEKHILKVSKLRKSSEITAHFILFLL